MQSLWQKEVKMPSFPKLEEEKKTDVLIIGGGFSGILCAYFLQKYGVDYLLVEAGRIAGGVSGCTTAKITSQHGLIYQKIAGRYGMEAAAQYYFANQMALENYKVLCKEIECDFEEKSNYVYSVKNRAKLEREIKALEGIHACANFTDTVPLPFATCGAVSFPNQAQFHPLKFLREIVKELHIYEKTKVVEFGKRSGGTQQVKLANNRAIYAKKIVVTTHFPMLNKHGSYYAKLFQHRSYVLALRNAPNLPGMYVDENRKGFSFRNSGNVLLFGGGGHRTGKKGGCFTTLRGACETFYPQAIELCRFATQDCMSLDGIPYIGRYFRKSDSLFVATGFNKWGMTSSMVAAMILSDMILGKKNDFEALFSPSRLMLTGQLAINIAESAMGLLSFSKRRCPHLGCALKWNEEEHSWDCPCHGSRFSKDGECLDNPANGNLR